MDKKDNSSAVFQSSHREAQSQRSAKGRKEELQARYQERFKTRSATKRFAKRVEWSTTVWQMHTSSYINILNVWDDDMSVKSFDFG